MLCIVILMGTAPGRRRRWLPWVIIVGIAVVLIAVVGAIALVMSTLLRPDPTFESLALVPDPSLSGTVAYFDDDSLCVRAVAASGQPNREVYCLESQQPSAAEKEGKDVGVDIEWLPDDRLQLTLYRMDTQTPQPVFEPAWRRIVDIRTGEVEEVPAAQFTGVVPERECITVSPSGQQLVTESDGGHAVVKLIDDTGERTLLDVRGNPETYGIDQACWAPNFQWVATNDNRLLVITLGEPPLTRALTPPMTTFYGYDALSWYAITSANLLEEQ